MNQIMKELLKVGLNLPKRSHDRYFEVAGPRVHFLAIASAVGGRRQHRRRFIMLHSARSSWFLTPGS